ncbi:hypothetical protein [Streptomyces sp. Amel2xC10]|uniref:hypothetical protein n=1 Tax=Streptomyces sp. Amel2xC10 TaxID=1305826 RepID=UPI000A087A14|nr:hypothetical protein [Streptomyces sp. Amel2xC10]SMF18277.1 hypothetical protein SAMN02745830_02114 [Streptomyces sp. Amel2xC10]
MTGSVEQGTSQTHGNTHILHFLVRLPRPMEAVWPALTTPEGIGGWWTGVDLLEPRLGGAVALHGPGRGEITAWDVDRVAEYALGGGRIRFHLERDGDTGSALRFTHEFRESRGDGEAVWRARFERLIDVVEGSP